MASFQNRKTQVLTEIFDIKEGSDGENPYDWSPKGSVDEAILDVLQLINSLTEFYTTSSCSGRASVFDRTSGKWLFVSHDFPIIANQLSTLQFEAGHDILLKFEPLILAIEAADMNSAVKMLRLAVDCGFRESGVSSSSASSKDPRFIVSIRCAVRMEAPLSIPGFDASYLSSTSFWEIIAFDLNRKFEMNQKKTRDLFLKLKEEFGKKDAAVLKNLQLCAKKYGMIVSKLHTKQVQDVLRRKTPAGKSKKQKIVFAPGDSSSMLIHLSEDVVNIFLAHVERLETVYDLQRVFEEDRLPSIPFKLIALEGEDEESKQQAELRMSPYSMMCARLGDFLNNQEMMSSIPKKWEILGNLALLPEDSFNHPEWENVPNLWAIVAECLGVSRLGRQRRVDSGLKRSSRAVILYSQNGDIDDGWVKHKENGVWYNFDVTKTMFASGNGTERKRLSEVIQPDEVVVDFYAGIGYFALPALVNSKLKHLYACEWNDHSLEALNKGIKVNKIDPRRVTVIPGDNRKLGLENIADRIFLGLLPSSEDGWPLAVQCLKPTGGVMHVHVNVLVDNDQFKFMMLKRFDDLAHANSSELKQRWQFKIVHTERVKSYAPKVDHMVFDVECFVSQMSPWAESKLPSAGNQLHPIPVIHVSEFDKRIRTPAIIKGIDFGNCMSKWVPDYLAQQVPSSKEVAVHVCPDIRMDFNNKNFMYKTMPFSDFIARASGEFKDQYFISPSEKYYLRSLGSDQRKDTSDIRIDYPEIANDFRIPFEVIPENRIFSTVLRISSPDCQLWTHYDVMDNLLFQIRGKKRVALFPPEEVSNLYVKSSSSDVIDIGIDNDSPSQTGNGNFSRFNLRKCSVGVLEEGDVLFIPALWFHNVRSLEFAISVNVFWKELDDRFYTQKDLYGNRDHLIGAACIGQTLEAVQSLESSKLPRFYQRFYLQKAISKIESVMEDLS